MSQLSMQYDKMEQAIKLLEKHVTTFESTTKDMTKEVNTLCENWKAQASPIYKEDYNKLSKNFTNTSQVVTKLIASTKKYLADMKQLDQQYSKSKVN